MKKTFLILFIFLFSSCSTKYSGLHKDFGKFSEDVAFCVKKSCKKETKSPFLRITFISPLFAYGGGGGGGAGNSMNTKQNKISYKNFNLCLKEKGYIKNENGIFELPFLNCNKI